MKLSINYSNIVNTMLFLFALFVNINNTLADMVLFGLAMIGVYVSVKHNINPFKNNRLRILLIITAGYYVASLVIFFINGTNFAKFLQTDIYFLLAVFVATAVLHAKVNIGLFFSGVRLALLFLGACHLLSFDCSNIYISIFAPIVVLMMFLSIVNYENNSLVNKLFGLTAFMSGMMLILDSGVRLSWLVFLFLAIVVCFTMFKTIKVSKLSLGVWLLFLTVFVSLVSHNSSVINSRLTKAYNEVSHWNTSKGLDTPVGIKLEMYKSAIEAFKKKPFFGYGYLNGTKEVSKYTDPKVRDRVFGFVQLHSEYITTMVEKGFFGLLFLIVLLLTPLLVIVRNYRKDDVFIRIGVVMSISFILFGVFNVSFGDSTIKAFYVLLISLVLPNIIKVESAHKYSR